MDKFDKLTLIKDLCARLPYGVKFYDELFNESFVGSLTIIDADKMLINHGQHSIENIKPYLFPMSSMTEEQRDEYKRIVHNEFLDYMSVDISVYYKGNDWLNEHHFDYRGLIEKSLAIDATNLNIY